MTKFQRIRNSLFGVAMIVTAFFLAYYPKEAYEVVISFLAIGFLVSGIATLSYYFTMARYMVGGKMILYRGVLLFDFAIFSGALTDVPRFYVLVYLAVIHLFSGLIEVLRSSEARGNGGKSWGLKLIHGIINITVTICCLVFAKKTNTAVYIYCAGIFYSGIIRIVQAFRKTSFVYIR